MKREHDFFINIGDVHFKIISLLFQKASLKIADFILNEIILL